MSVLLSSSDLARVRSAQEVLLAPLSHEHGDQWIVRSAAAVSDLLEATHATVLASGPEMLHSSLPDRAKEDFIGHFAARDEATPRALARGLCVAHLYDVVSPGEYLTSELHNEFAAPNGLFDAMLLRARPARGRSVWMAVQHGRALQEEEIERRRALLEIVLPSYSAGVTAWEFMKEAAVDLRARIDSLPAALLLVDSAGRLLHANRALTLLLAGEPGAEPMLAEMKAMGSALLRSLRSADAVTAPTEMVRVVRTGSGGYRLSAAPAGELCPGAAAVHVVPLSPTLPDAAWLRERFALTERELQVARLLGERLTNREIASALHISPHTAERHTERVLQKLSLRSRADVRGMILRG